MKFTLIFIGIVCCIAGVFTSAPQSVVLSNRTIITMHQDHLTAENNEFSACPTFCSSPAQANHETANIPHQTLSSNSRQFNLAVIVLEKKANGPRYKAYLSHIYPSHSIW